ncbi:transcriptional regulator [Yersinia frederiksenii]|uniref:transcriptional regulator n=1 Tax=Yersinia frederiksenii TaxID=29484 RepID=UPI0005DB5190|nr:transcriptional regulator [Yersinia frederiksenii]CQJ04137.1 putative regulatory protein [Yersinia frederiksenii]
MKNRTYIVNNWSIDLTSGFITHRETQEQKRLGEYQLKLLTVLLAHIGEILSRDELTNLVWKRRFIGNNSLPNAIHTLRVALGDENKQQRIIQTIPKMGYLLDPAFCEVIEDIATQDIPETAEPITDSTSVTSSISLGPMVSSIDEPVELSIKSEPTATDSAQADSTLPAVIPNTLAPVKKRNIFGWKNLLIGFLFVAVIIASLSHFLYKNQGGPKYKAIQQEQAIYSNIKIFQIVDANLSHQYDDNLSHRIQDTLYAINKQISASDIRINIYYIISLRRLDFTFMVENPCTQNQLNMTIYHWRQNDQLLNNLLNSEMERKINEMANCKK